ncbi:MAG: S8 family peptidase, partial [Ruminococcus sp.]
NIFQSAVDLAIKSGCVVVCAAGNENSSDYAYPSDCSGALSVIALDESCQSRASYSNYGGTDNKVSAPGTSILSTIPESYGSYNYLKGYEKLSGTSMSTPVVTAEAAMILSVNPTLTSTAVKEIIYNTCTDMGEKGYDKNYGYGAVNICDAVKTAYNTPSDDMPKSVKLSSSGITITKGDTYKVSATVTSKGNNKGVYYHTEDNGIAKVSQDGTITGVSDGETTLVVSTENSITAECVIKVQSFGSKKLDSPKVDEIQTGVYTGARINWSKIDNADYYQIYATTGDDTTFRYIGSTTSPSYAAMMGLGGEEVPASNVTKYKIKAVSHSSSYADSDFSNEFVYVYVGQEPNLKADQLLEQGKSTGLLIHWGAIVSSKLYRTSSIDGKQKLLATFGEDMKSNYYEDTDLTPGVTYTYTLKLFTYYKGVEYSEITSELVVNYIDDDPLNPSLGKCEINKAEFNNNETKLTCFFPTQCLVNQCLCSDNGGKSWFDLCNGIGNGEYSYYIDNLEFGKTYLIKTKSFENELFGLYRERSEYSDT